MDQRIDKSIDLTNAEPVRKTGKDVKGHIPCLLSNRTKEKWKTSQALQ
jgi:hypothetical protein